MKLVSIIIVNWNGLHWLKHCFSSLQKQAYRRFEIILVDNGSTDGSVAWVKVQYPDVRIVANQVNVGFAEANNQGYRASRGEYVVFLNNDTRVTKNFLVELVTVLESDTGIAGAQSKILLMDRPQILDSVGAFLTPTGFLYHYGFGSRDQKKFDVPIDLYTAKGACMGFKKTALRRIAIGGDIFDKDYFAYFEESDMCHRLWLAGFRIVYAYKSVIYHKMGGTSGRMDNAYIQYHSFKNRIRTYIKNFQTPRLLKVLIVHLTLCHVYATLALLRGNVGLCLAIERAIWWNIVHLAQTLKLRNTIAKKVRHTQDDEFLPQISRAPSLRYYIGLLSGVVNE